MTYTTDQAIASAREVGIMIDYEDYGLNLASNNELTALCNKVERDTLLEAAEKFRWWNETGYTELRQMAGVE